MFLRILVIFSLFLSLAFSQTAVVRVGKYPDKERIVLQLDRKVDYKVLTLESPKRIVVDIMEEVRVSIPKDIQVRVGRHPWGTRVVIEKNFDEVKAFSLQEPFRIVLDIYLPKAVGEPVAKKDEENELLEIVDPSFIRVLRYTENVKNQERVINQVRKSQLITQRRVIVIDPGHGGHDPGAIGYMNIREKEVVLAIGKKLAEFLEEDGRFKVIMTLQTQPFGYP